MTDLRISFGILTGSFEQAFRDMNLPIAEAASAAMDEVALLVKIEGRADISRAGFGTRWQNALRVDRYPKGKKVSVDAAAFLFHRIEYAGIFEDGATLTGRPMMWVPLDGTPPRVGGNLTTPARLRRYIPGRLVGMTSRNGTPLLGAQVRLSRTQAVSDRPKVTLAALKRGDSGTGVLRTLPLFFGVRQTNVRKQLNIRQICAKAADKIPSLYARNFKGD